jgi:hypothetical protein
MAGDYVFAGQDINVEPNKIPNFSVSGASTNEEQQFINWITQLQQAMLPPYQELRKKQLLLKPLTPYNYYYRDERDNIVSHISDESDPLPPAVSDFTESKLQFLLHQHWYIDPMKKKRAHRKSHGKMKFQTLSKVIADRWHNLPNEGRAFYRRIARYDDIYYHLHLDIIRNSASGSYD